MSRRVVLAGASGYGRGYLRELAELGTGGAVQLVGVCDVQPLDAEGRALVGDRPVSADFERLLRDVRPDVAIVATPIHRHVPMALQAFAAGAHLLLEKPPAATLAGWQRLLTCAGDRACQVGFQSLGSAAFARLHELVRGGELGELRGIGVWGAWSRTDGYYRRAAWAGRRTLDGADVVDGALTNPFAHAVQSALVLTGSTGEAVVAPELELLRARAIEADDTACLRLHPSGGVPIVVAVTLCAATESEPVLIAHGSRGRAELHYTEDVLVLDGTARQFGRTTPLRNLVAHLDDPRQPLHAPLADCGAFMQVLEAVRRAPEPTLVDAHWLRERGAGDERRVDVVGVEQAVRDAAETLHTFAELGVGWAPRSVAEDAR